MKKRHWIPAIIWMGIIFYLSHQPGGQSAALSGSVTKWMMAFIENNLFVVYDFLDVEFAHHFIRKYAHFATYFILGILTMYPLHKGGVKNASRIAFAICLLFAISDEIHQLFIPGRAGQVKDVLIDSSGAGIAILGYTAILKYLKAKKGI